jgi:adenylyl-sulfate kinase
MNVCWGTFGRKLCNKTPRPLTKLPSLHQHIQWQLIGNEPIKSISFIAHMPHPILWLFGLPCSGKTTLALAIQKALQPRACIVLDGDAYRAGVSKDLGFSHAERMENLRRAAETALLLADQGVCVIGSFVTPAQEHRDLVQQILGSRLQWLHVDCPLAVCQQRDVKGLYAKSLQQQMQGMTGVQSPFDAPALGIVSVSTHELDLRASVAFALEHWQGSAADTVAQ